MTAPNAVLVPLDFTPFAEQAIAVGTSLARRLGAPLHLVSVQEPLPVAVTAEAGPYGVDLERKVRSDLSRYLARTIEATKAAGADARGTVLDGDAADEIAEYVASHDVGLVVMTTHARKRLSRWVLGSVADRLLRRVRVPVLLLHPSELPQPTRFRRFLLALGGEADGPILEAALALGRLEPDPEYVLVRVAEPPVPLLTPLAASPSRLGQPHTTRDVEVHERAYLQQIETRLREAGHQATWRMAKGRNIPEQVLDLADETGADCIVMGTRGLGGIERLLMGSVAEKVVRSAALPVLVAPLGRG
jgi:nucleotide-binding universal stress UspA family protein